MEKDCSKSTKVREVDEEEEERFKFTGQKRNPAVIFSSAAKIRIQTKYAITNVSILLTAIVNCDRFAHSISDCTSCDLI
jgi:hypothetical protein